MRKSLFLVLLVLSVALVASGLLLLTQDAPPQLPTSVSTPLSGGEVARISVQELNEQLQSRNPPIVWEFVSAGQYASGHLPGARLMTFDELPEVAQGLQKSQPLVTLCT
jgi:hypothetical protein